MIYCGPVWSLCPADS